METSPQKTLERVISQRAIQMSSYFPCQIYVLGLFSGVCVTYLSLAAVGSFKTVGLGAVYSTPAAPFFSDNSAAIDTEDEWRVSFLYSAWSAQLNASENEASKLLNVSNVPDAPHLEDCKLSASLNERLDSLEENGTFPPWTLWKGQLGLKLLQQTTGTDQEQRSSGVSSEGAYPPWVLGSDEDNIPFTRRVQRDIWMHQHPSNCSDPNIRFLIADWEILPGFGIGAQIAGMCGILAIAINENRVLVTKHYNRADHNGCQGSSRSHWSCYFFPETSRECQDRALELMTRQESWHKGLVTGKENYTSKEIWAGRIPRIWGSPWSYLQPTTDISGNLVISHRKMDRRWWRAQAVRYLMRFQSEYTCRLMNIARHEAFGKQAAKVVLASLRQDWPEARINKSKSDLGRFIWSNHKPWIPRPILSMHVRMGDKASEMKLVGFEEYMVLAERIRRRFPNLHTIWLSTEMQEVIDQTKLYPNWNFYYTTVLRQVGNMRMAAYEASLGRETSTNYPLTNFLMATEADFFIGALGSTWCFLIDGMRNTGGKVMSGYLSVNKDRFCKRKMKKGKVMETRLTPEWIAEQRKDAYVHPSCWLNVTPINML
ncbi:hypothetical protein H6P81_012733 [Aristolochia fimbriata]|uniref:Alpha-(1,6)-fucosyltransferase n=1 Tax=Aristolochia fimbriata TaxID=158543 RepID=A0AAV7EET2_ARIFI|nr:hypothetical protein H6P81_012733 [Aristolochia fimbriata]